MIIEGIELRLDGAFETLDEALGLRSRRGQSRYENERARAEYNRLVLEWAAKFCADLKDSDVATKLVGARDQRGELEAYRDSFAWRNRDSFAEACPPKYRGRSKELFWKMLQIKDHVHSHSWVRNLLADERERRRTLLAKSPSA